MRRSRYKTTVQPEVYIDTHKNTEIDETIDIKQQYNQKFIQTHTKTQRLMRRSGYKTTVQPEVYIDTHKNTEIDETIQI